MTKLNEVLHRFVDSGAVVHLDVADVIADAAGVEKDHWEAAALHLRDQFPFHFGGDDRDAIDFSFEHAADRMGHAFGVIAGVRDKNFEAVAQSDLFKALYQLGEEWIRDVGNDQPQLMAAAGDERAG